MDGIFKKELWATVVERASDGGEYDKMCRGAQVLVLMEIRDAIEAQAAKLEEQRDWDQGALAVLMSRQSAFTEDLALVSRRLEAITDTVKALAGSVTMNREVTESLQRRGEALANKLDTFEQAVQSCLNRQGETAAKIVKIAEIVEAQNEMLSRISAGLDK
jgi:chromosome segregation ATPase